MCWCLRISLPIINNLLTRLTHSMLDILFKCRTSSSSSSSSSSSINHNTQVDCTVQDQIKLQQRPLPEIPTVSTNRWYRNVTRSEAGKLLTDQPDGTFLFRTTNKVNCLCTLVVVCERVDYHISVRYRRRSRSSANQQLLALGVPKANEMLFNCLDDIVNYHQHNQLQLIRNGRRVHSVYLRSN